MSVTTIKKVGTYKGLTVYHEEGEGYYAENGPDCFGYHDDIDELHAEIDDYWQGSEHGPLNGFFTGADV